MLISEIARILDIDLISYDESDSCCNITFAELAHENEIAICFGDDDIKSTCARTILISEGIHFTDKNQLLTSRREILPVAAQIANLLVTAGELNDYSKPVRYSMNSDGFYEGIDSKIGKGTIVSPGVFIGDCSVIGSNCLIDPNVVIGSGTKIGDNVIIRTGSVIGDASFYHYRYKGCLKSFAGKGVVIIGDNVLVSSQSTIERGVFSNTVIGNNVLIGHQVAIGHDSKIANNCEIVSQSGVSGGVVLEENVVLCGQSGLAENVRIGRNTIIYGQSFASKDVGANKEIAGPYSLERKEYLKMISMLKRICRG